MAKTSNRSKPVMCVLAFAWAALLSASPATAQRPMLLYADYGAGDSRTDVTSRIQTMVQNGNLNVVVNNETMGGDPAPGRPKELRLHVRETSGLIRELGFRERTSARLQLVVWARDYDYDDPGTDELIILRAYYGISNQTVDVTRRIRGMINEGTLVTRVDNETMGSDPAPEHAKVLFLLYQTQGERKAVIMHEHDVLRLP